ncbi:MAG: hypothetical protein JSR71_09060 [Proteobacteria bacterium]|nr:hypothetical protein [Pseudomonadota bacterium]
MDITLNDRYNRRYAAFRTDPMERWVSALAYQGVILPPVAGTLGLAKRPHLAFVIRSMIYRLGIAQRHLSGKSSLAPHVHVRGGHPWT